MNERIAGLVGKASWIIACGVALGGCGASSDGGITPGVGGAGTGAGGASTSGVGGASACGAGQTQCGPSCVVLSSNASNCGTCGNVCPVGTSCVGGVCACPTGFAKCNDACVDTSQAIDNCGGCGVQCGVGQLCQAGQCQCQTGLVSCGGACVDTQSSGDNCGTCGNVCTAGQVCSLGACSATCAVGTQCGNSCVDVATDVQNCGACSNACAPGQSCVGGTCSCPAGQTACNGVCVTTATDAANCGACGVTCATGQACQAGQCACTDGRTLCSGSCTDTQTDPANCGSCGSVCSTGQTCSAGTCTGGSGGAGGTGGVGVGGTSTGGAATGGSSTGGVVTSGGSSTGGAATGGSSTGGAATGGASTGGVATGGSSTGGAATGGSSTGGSSSTACPGADATEFETVSGWLNNTLATGALPQYAYDNIESYYPTQAAFDELACSIAMSCLEFAPNGWLRKCEAVIASAMVAESSYNHASIVEDSYGGAADPTVGLLQIRFSSTVRDYNYYGPMEKMAAIGCEWPSELPGQTQNDDTFWRGQGASYIPFMTSVPCNAALGTWYYFYNATGNGYDPNDADGAKWIHEYCAGDGVAGTMVVGLLSHLMGGNYDHQAVDGTHAYPWGIECCPEGSPNDRPCTGCTGRFAAFMGIGTTASRPSPDPFQEVLQPEPEKYCR